MGVTGSVTVKVLPRPGSLSTDTDPPRASAVFFTRESPAAAPVFPGNGGVGLHEAVEYALLPLLRDAEALSSTASVSSRLRPS